MNNNYNSYIIKTSTGSNNPENVEDKPRQQPASPVHHSDEALYPYSDQDTTKTNTMNQEHDNNNNENYYSSAQDVPSEPSAEPPVVSKAKKRKDSYNRGISLLPNLFTIGALFAGFYAIVAATKGLFEIAAIALFIAMLLDNLDGRVARLTNTQTKLGAELDSLSDMVAFGVAPSLILYHWSLMSLGKIGWLVAFFFTATTALRLARFNSQIDNSDKAYFKGLPAPVAAAVVVGFVWNCVEGGILGASVNIATLTAIITTLVALLMVSNTRYYSFKTIDFQGSVHYLWALLVVFLLIVIVLMPSKVLFFGCLLYTLSGFFTTLVRRRELMKNNPAS